MVLAVWTSRDLKSHTTLLHTNIMCNMSIRMNIATDVEINLWFYKMEWQDNVSEKGKKKPEIEWT